MKLAINLHLLLLKYTFRDHNLETIKRYFILCIDFFRIFLPSDTHLKTYYTDTCHLWF